MEQSSLNTDLYLSCDWGTSSLRMKLVNRSAGEVIAAGHSSRGVQNVYNDWSESRGTAERVPYYLDHLKHEIDDISQKAEIDPKGIPVVISGMASSSIGIRELPYTTLPFSLDDPNIESVWIDRSASFPNEILLLSGLCSSNDVMRGEETQLLGLARCHDIENSICILPGTHSKHIYVKSNSVTHFYTFISGELFQLLSTSSILKNSVSKHGPDFNEDVFHEGIRASGGGNLLNELFKIRSGDLIRSTPKNENRDFLSGLIIGTELDVLANAQTDRIFVAGGPDLQARYSSALDFLHIDHTPVAESEELAELGHRFLLNNINI